MTRRPLHPGLTMLEVVFALALLGLVVMAVMGVVSYVHGSQVREQRTLAAAELANRMILMYIDDPNSPWNEGETLAWPTGEQYRWELVRSQVKVDSAVPPPTDMNSGGAGFGMDRIHLIRSRVWLSEAYGGSKEFSLEAPHAEIARLMDPLSNVTRPDTTRSMYDKYRGSMSEFLRTGRMPDWRGRDGVSPSGGSK